MGGFVSSCRAKLEGILLFHLAVLRHFGSFELG